MIIPYFRIITCLLIALFTSCDPSPKTAQAELDRIAGSYVRLTLKIGQIDRDYVDAYYGPPEWKPAALKEGEQPSFTPDSLRQETIKLMESIKSVDTSRFDEMWKMRHRFLEKHLVAVLGRLDFLSGKYMTFDEESRRLYDAAAPSQDMADFDKILTELEAAIPGSGSLSERYNRFKNQFLIPPEKLDTVYRTALEECRRRTLQNISLPAHESFKVEYVSDKPWGAYNWYQGNGYSLIQVNTDLPLSIDFAIGNASHEGYPGHHVYMTLLDVHLYRERNWAEFCVYPLFSPLSLLAEGLAEYAEEMIFPGDERSRFERQVLYPLAGLDTARAAEFDRVRQLRDRLGASLMEISRRYLDGKIDREQAVRWLIKYNLSTPQRADRQIRFMEKYRSYEINYGTGREIVKNYVESQTGTEDQSGKRWVPYTRLLTTPQIPSALR